MFVFAVFFISLFTEGYLFGIFGAVIGTVAVNYALTFPYFAIDFTTPVNIISGVIMIAIAFLTSTLATKFKLHEAMTHSQKLKIIMGIKGDSEWLVRMVENLLSITRIDSGQVFVNGAEIRFTRTEYNILALLSENCGKR